MKQRSKPKKSEDAQSSNLSVSRRSSSVQKSPSRINIDLQGDQNRRSKQFKQAAPNPAPLGNYEEMAVGKGNCSTMMDEYPENYVAPESVVEQIQPLHLRVKSHVWKIRLEAYTEVLTAFGKGQLMDDYQQFLNNFIADSNLQAQEKGFRILELYVLNKKVITMDMNPIYKNIVEKGLASNKPEIAKKAQQVLVELFDKGKEHKSKIMESINEGINSKNPKIVSGCIDAITPLLANYGLTRLQLLKPFIREIEKLNENNNSGIKNSINLFFKEAYKWLGEALMFTVNKFKKPVQDQLKAFISAYKMEPMIPLRGEDTNSTLVIGVSGQGIDSYAFAEAANVIDKFDDRWCQQTLELVKWTEKKDAIEIAISAFSTPKIVNKDHLHLVSFINRLLVDSNLNVMLCGLKLLKNMANGLRKNFNQGAKLVYKQILHKLRDKKQLVVDEVHKVLEAILRCMNIEEMTERIKENLADKAPNMRVETLVFLKNSIKERKQAKFVKSFIESLKCLMNDATVEVREKTFETLCKIKSVFGLEIFGNIDTWKNVPKDKIMRIKNEPEIALKEEEGRVNNFMNPEKANPNDRFKSMDPGLKNPIKGVQPNRALSVSKGVENLPLKSNEAPLCPTPFRSNVKVNLYKNISSGDEEERFQTYSGLLFAASQEIDYILLREMSRVESGERLLKLVISLVERSFLARQISKEALEFLLMHNWSSHEILLSNLFRHLAVNHRLHYIIQAQPRLYALFQKSQQMNDEEMSPTTFIKKLHELSQQYIIEDKKALALKQSVDLVGKYTKINMAFDNNTSMISEIIIHLKALIFDRNIQIVEESIRLVGSLVRICVITKFHGKGIIEIILRKIDDARLESVSNSFLDMCLGSQPSFLVNQLVTMLPTMRMKRMFLCFISSNIETFFLTSTDTQVRSIILAMMECLNEQNDVASVAESIIDSVIISLKTTLVDFLGHQAQPNLPAKYLKKYRFSNRVSTLKLPEKGIRIQMMEESSQRELKELSTSSVQKLLVYLGGLQKPYSELSTPLPVDRALLRDIFTTESFDNYSDLLIRWLFWRFHIERPESVLILIDAAKEIMRYPRLHEIELFVLMSGTLGALALGPQVLEGICSMSRVLYEMGRQSEGLLFYINTLETAKVNVEQIVKIIISCYSNLIPQYLALLSNNRNAKKNTTLMNFLKANYDHDLLETFGFIGKFTNVPKQMLERSQDQQAQDIEVVERLIEALKRGGMERLNTQLQRETSRQTNTQALTNLLTLMMERLKEITTEKEISEEHLLKFIQWFTKIYPNLTPQLPQLQSNLKTTIQLLFILNNQNPAKDNPLTKSMNTLIMQIMTTGNFTHLCHCIFEGVDEFSALEPKNMVLLIYIRCLNKLKSNAYYPGRQLECYKIIVEHMLRWLAKSEPQEQGTFTFVQRKVRGQLQFFFDAAQPGSTQATIDALADYQQREDIQSNFNFLLTQVKVNNPPVFERKNQEIARDKRVFQCGTDEIVRESHVFKKTILSPMGRKE